MTELVVTQGMFEYIATIQARRLRIVWVRLAGTNLAGILMAKPQEIKVAVMSGTKTPLNYPKMELLLQLVRLKTMVLPATQDTSAYTNTTRISLQRKQTKL